MNTIAIAALLASAQAVKFVNKDDSSTLAQTEAEFRFDEEGQINGTNFLSDDIMYIGKAIGIT